MLFFEKDMAIDIGTETVLISIKGKGIQVREPAIVAVDRYTGKLLKTGKDAQKMLGRTPADILAIHPIANGVINDYDMTVAMLKDFISKVTSFSVFKPRVLLTVPGSITGVEERATIDAAIEAGARKVYLCESAVSTAVGAGIDITKPDGYMIVDIGAGTTEVAIVSIGGVAQSESIKIAGTEFDEAIVRYMRRKHNMLIGIRTAEDLKLSIGGLLPKAQIALEEVKGRDVLTGLPKTAKISSNELNEIFIEPAKAILESIHRVLEKTPPDLVADVARNGITMSGGGSLLYGFDKLVESNTGIRTVIADDPASCSVYGASKLLNKLDEMEDGMQNFARRRQLSK